MGFNEDEKFTIWIVQLVCGSISVICCLFICMCYLFYASLRGYEFRLIFYLSFADMIASIMYTLPLDNEILTCKFQGGMVSFATNLRLAFILVIASSIQSTHKDRADQFKHNERLWLFLIIVLSMFFAALPYTTDSYGNAGGLCWITISNNYTAGTIWRFSIFYGPLWVLQLYNGLVYYIVIKNMKELGSSSVMNYDYIDKAAKRLKFYPAILAIEWLPATINRIIEIFVPNYVNLYLTCVSLGFVSGIGFFNAVAYGLTEEVRYVLSKPCSQSGFGKIRSSGSHQTNCLI